MQLAACSLQQAVSKEQVSLQHSYTILSLHSAAQQGITTAQLSHEGPTGYVLQRPRRSSLVCQAGANGKHNAPERRVVVTGMGVVSSLGHEVEEFYDKLLQVLGVSVIAVGLYSTALCMYGAV